MSAARVLLKAQVFSALIPYLLFILYDQPYICLCTSQPILVAVGINPLHLYSVQDNHDALFIFSDLLGKTKQNLISQILFFCITCFGHLALITCSTRLCKTTFCVNTFNSSACHKPFLRGNGINNKKLFGDKLINFNL